ncbi:MAG: negative regulator of flagellin synthesis FlgM, partial [Oceanicoccus sp.]
PAAKTPDGSQVEFSNQANTLKAAEERIQSLPEVDSSRVAEVRAAIEKGEFKIDNQSIAEKMLATDALLG